MTINFFLDSAQATLRAANIATARLDVLVLLEDTTGHDRAWLLAHPEEILKPEQVALMETRLKRRAAHEPLAYIRGKTEFYGREFAVSAHTLEPRPETEDMIDLLKEVWQPSMSICDVGAGSGAIGITAALELDAIKVALIDIDAEALEIARQNVAKHELKLQCFEGDLLEGRSPYDIIIANLPYVPDSHTINQAAMQEPAHAIFGGEDGLDLYRRLFKQTKAQYVLTEALPFQHKALAEIAKAAGYRQTDQRGFIQLFTLERLA